MKKERSFMQCYKLSVLSRFMRYSLPKLLYNIDFTMLRIISVWAFSRGAIQPNHNGSILSLYSAQSLKSFGLTISLPLSFFLPFFLSSHKSKHAIPSLLFAIIDNKIETRYPHTRLFLYCDFTFPSSTYRKLKSMILTKQNRKRKCMKSLFFSIDFYISESDPWISI